MRRRRRIAYEREDHSPTIKKITKEILIWVIEILVVIGLAYFVVNFVLEKTTVVGDSMQTTLAEKDKVIINKFAYKFTNPKRFDIIVFKQSGKEHSFYNIKRVIGLPGEKIRIANGKVYINDAPLEEPIQVDSINIAGLAQTTITLDEKEYFVLGDNRNNSEDSRFANIGNIIKSDIVGKAWIKTDPFNFISQLNKKIEVEEENKTE